MKNIVMIVVFMACTGVAAQDGAGKIRLNQVGFYPDAPKVAIVHTDAATDFTVTTPDGKKVILKGKLGAGIKSLYSDKIYKTADFSAVTSAGKYVLVVPGVGKSYPFEVRNGVLNEVSKASIRNYYFQRMSLPLTEKHAGKWARPEGHPDNKILVHPSAASSSRPEGSVISAPKGWYDAGDYNKYVVNSGITMGTMFSAYEDYPAYYQSLELNIPESGNTVPDIIDELIWNLRWMLKMQDPADGGVYHKLTNPTFDGMVMPHDAVAERYVVQKGTAAALNFAAVTAQAARIIKGFDKQLPGLADSCLDASKRAWQWAVANPDVVYDQNEINRRFDPDVVTGAYGDRRFDDEFFWAGAELAITTKDNSFLNQQSVMSSDSLPLPSWNQVRMLGYYSIIRNGNSIPAEIAAAARRKVLSFAERLVGGTDAHAFKTVMGKKKSDYIWGSSSVAANQGVALMYAYRLSGKAEYYNYALANMDYLLGRNGTGYSFVTGYGSKQVMHPHHRPSEADGVAAPVPGMLSGGPNPGMQDKCRYESSIPEEAFTDDVCSYASNEIAINWNAPLVYLAGALEASRIKTSR